MKYILYLGIVLLASCGQKKGCINEWGSNYEPEAIVDCCCEFDFNSVILDIVGTYNMQEQCSGDSETYEIIVSKDSNTHDGIIISNFNKSGFSIKATWNQVEGEFKLEKNWLKNNCLTTTTGSIHKASGKIFFIYAAFPQESCESNKAITCEARSIL